jgi:hypothetical protein
MNRTCISAQAARNVERFHFSFKVLSVSPAQREGVKFFVVAVPMATTRSGFTGFVSEAILATSGTPTKFGRDLFKTVNAIEGVELSLVNGHPNVVPLFVSPSATDDTSLSDVPSEQVMGMPRPVCVAIEETILRNRGFGQLVAEWIRRI